MKKQLLSIVSAGMVLSSCLSAFAQERILPEGSLLNRGCATMEYKRMQEERFPEIKADREKFELEVQKYVEQLKQNPAAYNTGAVITIPIVFHIVYETAGQNVSDACINAQLAILNQDFRKTNPDVTKVTQTGWAALCADTEIEFCLAKRDPSGNATNGITRTSTTASPFSTNDAVKFTAQGGKDVWDRDKYFNVWVCDLSGGLLGYGQFPSTSPSSAPTDGLVIDYQYMVSAAGCGTAPYDKGRTSTHEVGHCVNLYHIWGDDGSACTGSDQVTDTPNQAGEHYGCFTAGSSQTDACTGTAPGTMWMNYMDYTDDACMYMFTLGQKARITATFNGPRAPLKTSNGCVPLTAVETLLSSSSISVFPNPSSGLVALELNLPNLEAADVIVYNSLGEIVYKTNQMSFENNKATLDLTGNQNGIYMVTVKTPDGTATKKVVISQ